MRQTSSISNYNTSITYSGIFPSYYDCYFFLICVCLPLQSYYTNVRCARIFIYPSGAQVQGARRFTRSVPPPKPSFPLCLALGLLQPCQLPAEGRAGQEGAHGLSKKSYQRRGRRGAGGELRVATFGRGAGTYSS